MLIIRHEQMATLGAYSRSQFRKKAFREMRDEWPEVYAEMGEDAFRKMIEDGIRKADKHGIEFKSDILNFLSLVVEWGADFEQSPKFPWAADILSADNPGTLKIQQLESRFDPLRTGSE